MLGRFLTTPLDYGIDKLWDQMRQNIHEWAK